MIKISRVISPNHMASLAKHRKISIKFNVFEPCSYFVGLLGMAVEAYLDSYVTVFFKLSVGVELLVAFFIVALETKVGPPCEGCSTERKLIHGASLALPVNIMAGKTCELSTFQGKIGGNFCLLLVRWKNVGWMNITVWSL